MKWSLCCVLTAILLFLVMTKKNSLLMFHYKIIHHIIFTNTDFEQNEKKSLSSFVPVSLFWKTN